MKVKRTEQIYIGNDENISKLCHLSKNLYNQFFNKEYAGLKSISDRQIGNRFMSKREKKLFMKRNRKIRDIMHKLSRAIVQYAELVYGFEYTAPDSNPL